MHRKFWGNTWMNCKIRLILLLLSEQTISINIFDFFKDCQKINRNLQFIICGWAGTGISNGYLIYFSWYSWISSGSKIFSSGSQVLNFEEKFFHLTKYSVRFFSDLFLIIFSTSKTCQFPAFFQSLFSV